MAADGHLLLLLHAPPEPGNPDRESRLYWRNDRGEWKASKGGGMGIGTLRNHIQEFSDQIDRLENKAGSADTADEYFHILRIVGPLHRTCRNLHLALQQARESLPDDHDLIVLRDKAAELERAAELLHQEMGHGLEYTQAKQAEEQAEAGHQMAVASHRLNVLAALFFPVATLSAVLGMNIPHGLEKSAAPYTFLAVLAGGFLTGVIISAMIVRRGPQKPKERR